MAGGYSRDMWPLFRQRDQTGPWSAPQFFRPRPFSPALKRQKQRQESKTLKRSPLTPEMASFFRICFQHLWGRYPACLFPAHDNFRSRASRKPANRLHSRHFQEIRFVLQNGSDNCPFASGCRTTTRPEWVRFFELADSFHGPSSRPEWLRSVESRKSAAQ